MDWTPYKGCVLVVASLTLQALSIELEEIGELSVLLPWSLDYPEVPAYWHEVSWSTFGDDGIN